MNTFRIKNNLTSTLAYRNLSESQSNLQTTLERLSSGLRINKAADDSAGLTISTRMSNQIHGMKQANENAQQANNLIQTAESGLYDINSMLSRMRELATQAATDILNDSDRASINLEFEALKSEVNRVAHATEYNEMNLLNGTDYKNEIHRANTTADDVKGISIKNAKLSNDIRKGIYTLSDRHVDVSDQADISNLSGTAITEIRYSTSSLQPAHGKIHSINSQVNPAEVDIINGDITVADVDYISSAKIGDYSLRSKVIPGTADISNLSDITSIGHGTSPTTRPGNYTVKAKVNAGTADISNLSDITSISHGTSPTTRPGNYTVKAKVNAGTANISNLSDITSISHGDSAKPGNYTVEAKVNAGTANISNLTSTAIDEVRHDASTVSVPVPPGDYTVSVTEDKRDYRLMLSNGNIELETTSNGTAWTSASSDTISANSVSQGSSFTFQTADGKDVTVTFPDSDSDGVLDFKDGYPNDVGKVKDLPSAFSSLSGNLQLWLDSREWSAIETDGTNASNWIDFSGKRNHIDESTASQTLTLNEATMIVVTKAGDLTPTDSNAGGIQLSASGVYDEVLVFDRVLTDTEKTQISDYLTNKWGLSSASGIITFTNAGATGRLGPTQSQIGSAYAGTDLAGAVTVTQGIQEWTVPESGEYDITVAGARGGDHSNTSHYGDGRIVSGRINLGAGNVLSILVGQMGAYGGGGGGSFVWDDSTSTLIIAGGGGGGSGGRVDSTTSPNPAIAPASETASGFVGTVPTNKAANLSAVTGGPGQYIDNTHNYWDAQRAAGWSGDGNTQYGGGSTNTPPEYYTYHGVSDNDYGNTNLIPRSPLNGGQGGVGHYESIINAGLDNQGGFGGGAGGGGYGSSAYSVGGGGGGYGGGGNGSNDATGGATGRAQGGGGSSYISHPSMVNESFGGTNSSHGFVEIGYDIVSAGTHSNTVDSAPDKILSAFEVSFSRTATVQSSNSTSETVSYDYTDVKQTVDFPTLGLHMDIIGGKNLGDQMSSPRTFTVDPTLEVKSPTVYGASHVVVEEEPYSFNSNAPVTFDSLGLTVNPSDASNMTVDLYGTNGTTSKTFTVNPTLEMTPPGGSAVDTGYDFNSTQTVDFSSLSLDVDTSNAATMTTALLHNPKTFTVHPTLSIDTPAYGFDSSSSVSTSENTIALPAAQVSALTVGDPVFYAKPNGGTVVGGLTDGSIYYVQAKPSDTAIALSSTSGGSAIDLTAAGSSEAGHTLTPVYEFNSSSGVSTSENTITLPTAQVSALTVGDPVVYAKPSLSGTVVGGLTEGTTYYVESKPSSTAITLSSTSGGSAIDLTAAVSSEAGHTLTRATNSTYSLADTSVNVPDLGLEVDTNNTQDTQTMTNVLLNSPQDFFVPETRELTLTGENGVQQSLQYRVGYDTTLNFDKLGIQLDIKGSPSHSGPSSDSYNPHTDSLDGKQIEIAPNRDLQVGADNDVNHQLKLGITSVTASGLEIGNESVVDIDQARAAITSLDTAIDVVNRERSYLASEQNRLAFTMSNLASQTQNIESSRSSIQDADFASEAMNLTKAQILSQSSSAMLAQANALTQNILSLLR